MPKVKAQIKNQETTQEQTQEVNPQNQPIETPTDSSTEYDKIEELKVESEQVEQEPIKRKRGRPKKSETEVIEPQLPEINVAPLANIIIDRLPNPLPLTDSESSVLNSTFNKVLQKYSGNIKYIEEINLSLVLVGILLPRLKKNKAPDEKA